MVFSQGRVARGGQVVGASAASTDGLPVAGDQPGPFESVQRRIDGAGGQVEGAVASGPECLNDGVPVLGSGFEDGQQQGIQVTLEQFRSHRQHHVPPGVLDLAETAAAARARVGGKAAVLAELAVAGLPVPPGVVVTVDALDAEGWETALVDAAGRLGGSRFAVRSSGAAEDLPDASYAGLYETYLDVPVEGLADAVRRCSAAAGAERVTAYHHRHGGSRVAMAVLVQVMVHPVAAGVAFTAHPVTGARDQIVVTAVAGQGDQLVSGEVIGEEWTLTRETAAMTSPAPSGTPVLTAAQAQAVTRLAVTVADRYGPAAGRRVGHRPRRHPVAAAGPTHDRGARAGRLDSAGAGFVDAELPAG
jgi:pyruvate phosphate dikinase-like enzyme